MHLNPTDAALVLDVSVLLDLLVGRSFPVATLNLYKNQLDDEFDLCWATVVA